MGMGLAIIFPEHESFYERMGVEIYENYPEVASIYKKCKSVCGFDLKKEVIYGETGKQLNEEQKKIAVLVTSVACYTVWKSVYQIEPDYYFGCGLGLLSALICTKAISLSQAIKMLQGKKVYKLLVKKPESSVVSIAHSKVISTKQEVIEEIADINENMISSEKCESMVRKLEVGRLLEIGPGNVIANRMQAQMPQSIIGYLDKTDDTNYILEHFQYHKNQSRYYCVLRILGLITSTRNNNDAQENYDEIITAYLAVKDIVDKATRALFSGESVQISDEEYEICLAMLKQNFQYKKTDKVEILERLQMLEGETLFSVRESFREIYE